jgi:hypothetical protein
VTNNPSPDDWDQDSTSNQFATAFGQQADPLAQYSDTFHDLPDPFEYFIENVLRNRDTIEDDETIIDEHTVNGQLI